MILSNFLIFNNNNSIDSTLLYSFITLFTRLFTNRI